MADYSTNGFSPDNGEKGIKCPVCGEEVSRKFRFCPACGTPIPEMPDEMQDETQVRPAPSVSHREQEPGAAASFQRETGSFRDAGNDANQGKRFRSNAERTEASFREFNAVARSRRRRDNRKSALPLVFALLVFLASLGGGVYWFLRQAEELPWDSAVVQKPEKGKTVVSPDTEDARTAAEPKPDNPADAPSDGGATARPADVQVKPAPEAAPAGIPEITAPMRGVVIGSSVNLRGSHTIESPVVGRVTSGKRVEVTESWTPDDSAEAVTLADLELTAANGTKRRVARGRGVTVTSLPDTSGMVTVTLPEDRDKAVYRVSAKSLSDPQAWPWYRVKPQGGGKEGWIFGKFLTVLNSKEEGLSPLFLDSALTSYGTTKEQIQEVLGKPGKTATRKIKNARGNAAEITLTFGGGTFILYEGPDGPDVRKITVTTAKLPLDGGLAVGMERRQVLSLLGYPNDLQKGYEIYRADKNSGIRIQYENYRVKSLTLGVLN